MKRKKNFPSLDNIYDKTQYFRLRLYDSDLTVLIALFETQKDEN